MSKLKHEIWKEILEQDALSYQRKMEELSELTHKECVDLMMVVVTRSETVLKQKLCMLTKGGLGMEHKHLLLVRWVHERKHRH